MLFLAFSLMYWIVESHDNRHEQLKRKDPKVFEQEEKEEAEAKEKEASEKETNKNKPENKAE